MPRRRRFSVLLAATALLLAPAAPVSAGGPPVVFPDPFAFTGPDYENGLAVFVNTSRESFCTPEQVDREQMVVDWLLGGMVDPFPEEALERPEGFQTWTPKLVDSPKGAIAHLRESDQHLELWRLDAPEDSFGVGACLDTDDTDEMLGTGTASVKATATDLFESGARPHAVDHFSGKGSIVATDGARYTYSFFYHQLIPCDPDKAPRCEVARTVLTRLR
jgi:hypothetical protein